MGWAEGSVKSNGLPAPELKVADNLRDSSKSEYTRLIGLSETQITAEYEILKEKKAKVVEAKQWFNQDHCKADYEYWLKMPYWSIEEGLLLANDRDPRRVTFEKLQGNSEFHPLTRMLLDQLQVAKRSAQMKTFNEINVPSVFIGWMSDVGFKISEQLIAECKKNDLSIPKRGEKISNLNEHIKGLNAVIKKLTKNQELLEETVKMNLQTTQALQASNLEHKDEDEGQKRPDERQLKTMEKMILAMAVDVYGFKPDVKRLTTKTDIAKALASIGLEITEETIANTLKRVSKHYDASNFE